jgi:acyl-coenzyme A synthetase/AMP-(fatty) acid ligase
MLRTIYGDHDRYVKQYWSRWGSDIYFHRRRREARR